MLPVVDTALQPISAPSCSPVRVALSAVFGAMAVFAWFIFGLMLLLLAPKFREIFADFGVPIPGLSLFFLGLSARWALAAALIAIAAGLSAAAALRGWLAVAAVSLGVALLVTVSFVAAMQMPLVYLTNNLAAGGG